MPPSNSLFYFFCRWTTQVVASAATAPRWVAFNQLAVTIATPPTAEKGTVSAFCHGWRASFCLLFHPNESFIEFTTIKHRTLPSHPVWFCFWKLYLGANCDLAHFYNRAKLVQNWQVVTRKRKVKEKDIGMRPGILWAARVTAMTWVREISEMIRMYGSGRLQICVSIVVTSPFRLYL